MTRIMMLSFTGTAAVCLFVSGCAALSSPANGLADVSGTTGRELPEPIFDDPAPTRVAAGHLRPGLTSAPFSWQTAARTAAGAELQTVVVGHGEHSSVIVGSIGGHDPPAVRLTEELAQYLYANSMIVGGVRATVIRTLNPDGRLRKTHRNAAGIYLNRRFPANGQAASPNGRNPEEIRYLLGLLRHQNPHRVIHIRTVQGSRPMIAASRGAMQTVNEVAGWLDADLRTLPDASAAGTMESYVAEQNICEMITVGIPRTTPVADVWTLYGDGVLSLLMDGDSESRRIARGRNSRQSADRRRNWDDTPNGASEPVFHEDSASGVADLPPLP